MKITPDLFRAYLECPTKCWLRAAGEASTENTYAEWVKTQNKSFRTKETTRLVGGSSNGDVATLPELENLKSAKWRLVTSVAVQTQMNSCAIESNLAAVERVPSEGRGKAARFIPIRFIFRNKLTKDDWLLLAFDALVLSEALGREVSLGKIIHGDDHATLKVKLGARTAESARTSATSKGLVAEVRKQIEKMAALLSNPATSRNADNIVPKSETGPDETRGLGGPRSAAAPPDLVLNRHCAECEFRDRCRKIAIEKDDLSLFTSSSTVSAHKLCWTADSD